MAVSSIKSMAYKKYDAKGNIVGASNTQQNGYFADLGSAENNADLATGRMNFGGQQPTNTGTSSGGGSANRSGTQQTTGSSQQPSYSQPANPVSDGRRYTQTAPSAESEAAGLGNPTYRTKKKKYDQFGKEITDITPEAPQGPLGPLGEPMYGTPEYDKRVQKKQEEEADKKVQSDILEPLDRQMTEFDRANEDLTRNQERGNEKMGLDNTRGQEDIATNIAKAERDIGRNIADTGKQMTETLQKIDKEAAVSGSNMVSTFAQSRDRTVDKFNTAMSRMQEDLGQYRTDMELSGTRLQADYDRSVKEMLSDYTMNTQRTKEDFNYNTRSLRDMVTREASVMVEKYGLSSEKLSGAISDLRFSTFKAVSEYYNQYQEGLDKHTDALVNRVNQTIQNKNDYMNYEKDLIQNYVDNSGNMTVNDLDQMVKRGEMSEPNAKQALSRVVSATIAQIDTNAIPGVGAMFQDQIVEGMNAGFTPNQVMQQIMKSDDWKAVIKQVSDNDPMFALKMRQQELNNKESEQGLRKGQQDIDMNSLKYKEKEQERIDKMIETGGRDGIGLYSQNQRGKNKLQCGELVNDYWTKVTGNRAGMGNDYTSKSNAIDKIGQSATPVVGGVFAQNIGEFGHTGIVTQVFADGSIEVYEANTNGSKEGTIPKYTNYSANSVASMKFSNAPAATGLSGTGTPSTGKTSTTDINVFNSLTAKGKSDKQNDPDYIKFNEERNAIMNDENASTEDILKYSKGGNKLGDGESLRLNKYETALNQITDLNELMKGQDTGPLIGIIKSNNPRDVKAQTIKAQIISMIPNLARGVYGEVGVLTDNDVALYSKTVPNLKSTKEVNDAILSMTMKLLANGYKTSLQGLAASSNDVSGYGGIYKNLVSKSNALLGNKGGTQQDTTQPTSNKHPSLLTGTAR